MSWLNDLYGGTVTSNEDGEYKGKGWLAAALKPLVDEGSIESGKQQGAVRRTITAAGEDPADYNLGPGATVFDAQGAVATTRRTRAEKSKEGDRTHETSILETSLAPQIKGIEAQIAQGNKQHAATMQQLNNQNNIATAQLTQSNNQFMAQLADTKDQRAMELQIRREELDRADQRDARNRRRDSIASLTSGLAALGAAFAL